MIDTDESRATPLFHRLDADSQLALKRFTIRVAVALVVIGASYDRASPGVAATWLALVAICCSLVAVVRREKLGTPSLNHWDEALAFTAFSALAHHATRAAAAGSL